MDYVIGGNVMLDSVRFADGATSPRESIGGPAVFAYSGYMGLLSTIIKLIHN